MSTRNLNVSCSIIIYFFLFFFLLIKREKKKEKVPYYRSWSNPAWHPRYILKLGHTARKYGCCFYHVSVSSCKNRRKLHSPIGFVAMTLLFATFPVLSVCWCNKTPLAIPQKKKEKCVDTRFRLLRHPNRYISPWDYSIYATVQPFVTWKLSNILIYYL
jgi:hypothetical protein